MKLTDEEQEALAKAEQWMFEDGSAWPKMDEGYKEACILANLVKKQSRLATKWRERCQMYHRLNLSLNERTKTEAVAKT